MPAEIVASDNADAAPGAPDPVTDHMRGDPTVTHKRVLGTPIYIARRPYSPRVNLPPDTASRSAPGEEMAHR